MAVLRKRKTARGFVYDIDFTFQGKRYIKSTKTPNYRNAKKILDLIQGKIATGTFNLTEATKVDLSLKEFLYEKYLPYAESYKRKSTMDIERLYCKKFLDFIGNKNLRSINVAMIDQWKVHFAGKVSPTTFNIAYRLLKAMFNVAKKWEYIEKNPFDLVQKLKVDEHRLYLMDNEIDTIMEVIDKDIRDAESNHHYKKSIVEFRRRFKLFVEFLLNTGLRREESLKLMMNDVDLAKGIIFIHKTKTYLSRTVPLNRRAMEIIQELSPTLFTKMHYQVVTEKFRQYLKKAELKGFKLHSLRHTFATRLVAVGIDLYTISRILGHTDIKTTMIYAKTNILSMQKAVDQLANNGKILVRLPELKTEGQ